MSQSEAVIHDIGYQRYQGPRLGRAYAVRSLFAHSLRTAYGLGRSAKAKIFPWLVVAIMGGFAAVVVAIHATVGTQALSYLEFVDQGSFLVLLFCAVVAPELVSRDLRNQVLPLYFARPLRRSDYALAKLAAMVGAAWLLLAGPQLVMFIGASFIESQWSVVWSELGDLLPALAYAALVAAVYGGLALLVASLISRRAVAAGAIVAVFLVTSPIVGVLEGVGGQTAQQLSYLASPLLISVGVQRWLLGTPPYFDIGEFGPLYAVVTAALFLACVGLLVLRYRRVGR